MWSHRRRSEAVSHFSHPPGARWRLKCPGVSIFVQVATPQAPERVPAQYLLSPHAAGPRTLIDILYDTAACFPEAAAIDDGTVQLTYSELISDIEASVAWLAARGIGRGDRIGIRMPSGSFALYEAILATLASRRGVCACRRRRPGRTRRAGVQRGQRGRDRHRSRHDPRPGLLARLAGRGAAAPRRRVDHLHLRIDRHAQGRRRHASQRGGLRRRRGADVLAGQPDWSGRPGTGRSVGGVRRVV